MYFYFSLFLFTSLYFLFLVKKMYFYDFKRVFGFLDQPNQVTMLKLTSCNLRHH